jgi:8-oxo-dGTP pyrophosphatase MutT (NUDIX family)
MFVPAPAPNEYVAGFAFSTGHNYVALVRKQKPEWQAGLLNGVGGKVEPDETPADAIYREFTEECSLQVKRWRYFATVSWIVDDRFTTGINYGREAEHVEVFPIKWLGRSGKFATIPNLAWLIPLAVEHMRGHSAVIVEEIDGRG